MASVLVVCTGNICRSPMAEGLLRIALAASSGPDAPEVSSAGTAGWEGSAAMPEAVAAVAELGVDLSAHRARRLAPEHVEEADLVLAMADEHREAVVRLVPAVAHRTFTLKELVLLLEALPRSDSGPADPPALLAERLEAADRLRRDGFRGNPHNGSFADPLGLPAQSYRALAWEIQTWCGRLVDGLYGRPPAPAGAGPGGR